MLETWAARCSTTSNSQRLNTSRTTSRFETSPTTNSAPAGTLSRKPRGEVVQHHHALPGSDEPVGETTADESGAAGDEKRAGRTEQPDTAHARSPWARE